MEKNKELSRVLIEDWFPFEEVGIECRREKGMSSALPPVNYLHVWWARRPLSASKGAIIASLLPKDKIEDFKSYMNFCEGLKESFKKIQKVKRMGTNERIGYSGKRSFKIPMTSRKIKDFTSTIRDFWKDEEINILDCFSGGGSIPFEASRLKLNTYSSDLNPVALVIQYATYYFPIVMGRDFFSDYREYFERVIRNTKDKLIQFFPEKLGQENNGFIWVRTIICPDCQLNIPLSSNWRISKTPLRIVRVIVPNDNKNRRCSFSIVEKPTKQEIESNQIIKKGKTSCPRCNTPISGDYIRTEAIEDRIGHQLITIVYLEKVSKKKKIRKYRVPEKRDLDAINKVNELVIKQLKEWESSNLIPNEEIEYGHCTSQLVNKGVNKWFKLFNPRQLFTVVTLFNEILELKKELLDNNELEFEEIKAIVTYLQIFFDKIIDRNSLNVIWLYSYERLAHTFSRHDFGFRWSYSEMEVIQKGFDWALANIEKAYKELIKLLGEDTSVPNLKLASADNLEYLKDKSIHCVVIDPPYYNNVMYAELSDFFYVWMKRSLGDLYPELFQSNLTNKDKEAVANSARFEGMGTSKVRLAKQDYEAKMKNAFYEIHRVLKDNGVLTIMFTHKATDAWDTLTMSLMEAGFEITGSWPVHTESEISLNIAKKNAVKTTIFLVCRKRVENEEELWWEDDILPEIRRLVTKKAKEFKKLGIEGVDLFISCLGPALKEFSRSYPVKNIAGDIVRAEEAIKAARKIVVDITIQDIIKRKSYNIDPISKFYLTAWYFFKARRFPFDEARRLAISIGINIDDLKNKKIIKKKSGDVELLFPKEREQTGSINVDNPKDNGILINAVHIGLLAYEQGGQKLFDIVIEKLRRNTDNVFRHYMETLFNILPDVQDLTINLPEKKILGEILMTTEEKVISKGGKITDFLNK